MRRSLTDVNKHRHLTSLFSLIDIPYATQDINLSLFLIKASLELKAFLRLTEIYLHILKI